MANYTDAAVYIKNMPRAEFRQQIIRGVGKSKEFSALVSLGADDLNHEERIFLYEALKEIGIPVISMDEPCFDEWLENVGRTITTRAVALL